jgi:hypothetical protein
MVEETVSTPAPETAAPTILKTTTEGSPAEPVGKGKWYEGVNHDIYQDPTLTPFIDDQGNISKDILKSYVHAQRSLGRKRLTVPDKNTTPAEYRELLHELGLPKDKSEYKINKAPGSTAPDDSYNSFVDKAFELGVMPKQAEQILGWLEQTGKEATDKYNLEQDKIIEQKGAELKKEWGDNYQRNFDKIKVALYSFTQDPKFAEQLIDSELGNNTDFLKLMLKVSSALDEDKFDKSAVPSHFLTKDTAERKIRELQGNFDGPYYNKFHPAHESAVREVNDLFKVVYG